MKILHLISFYKPAMHGGGPVFSVHDLNRWLVKKGVDVTVYATNMDGAKRKLDVPLCEPVDVDGVKVYYFPVSRRKIWDYRKVFFLPALLPRGWEYSKEMHKALAENTKKFDVVHITSIFISELALAARYAKKAGVPYVVSPRGTLMEPMELKSAIKKKIYMKLIENKNLANASAVHFTVLREKEEYIKHAAPFKKAIIIPNGLDEEEFEIDVPSGAFREKWGIDKDKKIVLFLARISWKKGVDTLIPAFAEVVKKEPNALLVIAGTDDEGYKKDIEKWIHEYGVEKNVLFTGVIMDKDKIAALRDSDVFVLPSYSENFGMAVVEAMHFGLPVIITKKVGVASSVKEGGGGLVIDKDEAQLTEAILKILKDPEMAKRLGEEGRRLVRDKFSMSQVADRWIQEYTELIETNKQTTNKK